MSERDWMLILLCMATMAVTACRHTGVPGTTTAGDQGGDGTVVTDVGGGEARTEPVSIALTGWAEDAVERADAHLRRAWRAAAGDCRVELDRWWGLPPTDGGIMQVASRRTVTVAGSDVELLTTAVFQGATQEVQALFYNETEFTVRIVLRGCTPEQTDEVLAAVRVPGD